MKKIIKRRLPDLFGIVIVFSLVMLMLTAFSPIVADGDTSQPMIIVSVDSHTPEQPSVPQFVCLGEFQITAYCSCYECCGKYAIDRPLDEDGNEIVYGAAMIPLKEGVSIAADTSIFPYGSELIIDGHTYVVQDCGSAIEGNKLDIYFNNHTDAKEHGIQYKKVYIQRNENYEQTGKSENQISLTYDYCDN